MNTDWQPKVSIIVPVYNGANYMREAIESALNQTYTNIEVIVVNDGSTDDGETERIALSYGERIKYISKKNGGVSSALNEGIRQMTGEYFSWLSHDDVYLPRKIENQINGLRVFEKKDAVGLCGHFFINERSEHLSKQSVKRFVSLVNEWDAVLKELLINGAFSGCALLIPKKVFNECGFFHEGLRFSQDALMWMEIFMKGYSLVYNDDKDVMSRIHGKQLTQNGRALFQKDSKTIGEIVIPNLTKLSTQDKNFLFLFAKRNAKNGNYSVVEDCIAAGKDKKLISPSQRMLLSFLSLYGRVRPSIRKVYYKLFVKPV
ncbi:MAG: glycosyltransferase [Clostridia bacterium]|nr:glycosyltransferase [Clostridia bacterium]